MADRDDAMDVGAIEDDALNDDEEENENGDEVEEGYKMAKVSGCVEINQCAGCTRQFLLVISRRRRGRPGSVER